LEQYDEVYKGQYPSHRLVFERQEDFGLVNCTKHFCGDHVRTYFHSRGDYHWQDDYLFISKHLIEKVEKCEVLNTEQHRELSDHLPIMIELAV
jgi:exonuclease III